MGRTSFRQISFDIDLDEVYSEMGSKDCEEMTRWLYEDGYFDEYLEKEKYKNLTSHVTGWNWEEICNKLLNSQLRLTNEEEEIIKKIADRL